MFIKIDEHDMVTHNFLRYTFRDVISNRFKTKPPHSANAALEASTLFINQLKVFYSFFTLKTEVFFTRR